VGELITEEIDSNIFHTISLIKNKDQSIYDSSKEFFSEDQIKKASLEWKQKQKILKSEKPLTLKDYHRNQLLGKETELTFVQEQEQNKLEFIQSVDINDEEELFVTKPVVIQAQKNLLERNTLPLEDWKTEDPDEQFLLK
jgi:hypothetical protein